MNKSLLTCMIVASLTIGWQSYAQSSDDELARKANTGCQVEEGESVIKSILTEEEQGDTSQKRRMKAMPSFPGGQMAMMQFIAKNLRYPESAIRENKQGRVSLLCSIASDGTISSVKVGRSSGHKDLDAEAIRVVKLMPKFVYPEGTKPNTEMIYHIPISFRMSDKELIRESEQKIEQTTKSVEPDIADTDKQIQETTRQADEVAILQDHVQKSNNRLGEDYIYDKQLSEAPRFPGGVEALISFLSKEINYPKEAIDAEVQGRVYLSFVVERDGSVSKIRVVRSSGNKALDREALRVARLLQKFEPGKINGTSVRARYILPVSFRMSKTIKDKNKAK